MNKENASINDDSRGKAFIDSMRKKFEARSREIEESMEIESLRLKEESAREIKEFLSNAENETAGEIAAEIEKVSNRAEIDKRKAKLALIEEITQGLIAQALELLRTKREEECARFYKNILVEIARDAQKGSVLYCNKDDMDMMRSLKREVVKETDPGDVFAIEPDDSIEGGFLFYDHEGGRTFNYTFERMVYRRLDAIRRQVYQAIAESIKIDSI